MRAAVQGLLAVAVVLALPSVALGATPPVLTAPAAEATGTEGGSLTFEWQGELQGDPATLTRSSFRLEVARSADIPSGAQAEWPTTELVLSTTPGDAVTSLAVGVPAAGSYRWRVCAMGVVDELTANEIVPLPSGCSNSRALTTVAAAAPSDAVGTVVLEKKIVTPGKTVTVRQLRPETAVTTPPAPTVVAPEVKTVYKDVVAEFQEVKGHVVAKEGSAVDLGKEDLISDSASDKDSVGGAVMGGLTGALPLVPIPFWTLALLFACLPIANLWRKDVLRMFDWDDGSVDGLGTSPSTLEDLPSVSHARHVKHGSMTADGEDATRAPVRSTSDRGRPAA